jgi:hypothetical protein
MPKMPGSYRAFIKRSGGPSGGSLLHLTGEDDDASICGIPRASLVGGGMFDELVCSDCIKGLPRAAVTGTNRKAQPS